MCSLPQQAGEFLQNAAELVDKQALAACLRITVRGLNKIIARGALPPPFKLGRKAYWRRDTLTAFFQGCERKSAGLEGR
jgi:hypothetical protein